MWIHRRFIGLRGEWGQFLLASLLGVGAALLLISRIEAVHRPGLAALAEERTRCALTVMADKAVTDALAQQGASYSDLVTVHWDADGGHALLSTDTVRLNRLRASVLEEVTTELKGLGRKELGIPLGAVLWPNCLATAGPRLPVRVTSVVSAAGTCRNEFDDEGDQTLHRIILDLTVTARLLFPGGVETVELSVPVLVAETVMIR